MRFQLFFFVVEKVNVKVSKVGEKKISTDY